MIAPKLLSDPIDTIDKAATANGVSILQLWHRPAVHPHRDDATAWAPGGRRGRRRLARRSEDF